MQVLFEDKYLICVNKPAMVLSQPSQAKDKKTIQFLLEEFRPDLKGQLYLHHRLDYETSGIFLFSKSKSANANLTEMFQQHLFEKIYRCLCRPNTLKPGKKVECVSIDDQQSQWVIKNRMAPAKGLSGHKRRMVSVKNGGWPAETAFQILKSTSDYHYVQCLPKTGRTHQIRLHLQESSRSILGDQIYGGQAYAGQNQHVPRLMLHAYQLNFLHPITREKIYVEAPLPEDFLKILV